jgi:hypothetical protein
LGPFTLNDIATRWMNIMDDCLTECKTQRSFLTEETQPFHSLAGPRGGCRPS